MKYSFALILLIIFVASAYPQAQEKIILSPTNIEASSVKGVDAIMISWKEVPSAQKYHVFRSSYEPDDYTEIGTTVTPSYNDTTAEPGITYYYKIKSWNASAGMSEFSMACKGFRKLSAPVITATIKQPGKVEISWGAIKGAVKYYVYRSLTKDRNFQEIDSTEALKYTDKSITPGTTYYYQVSAWNINGFGENSESEIGSAKNSITGLALRTIVPGWGQFYLNRNIEGGIFAGAFAASVGVMTWSLVDRAQKKKEYDRLGPLTFQSTFDKKWKAYEKSTHVSWGCIGLVGLIYVMNWIDVFFLGSTDVSGKPLKGAALFNYGKTNIAVDVVDYNDTFITETKTYVGLTYSF